MIAAVRRWLAVRFSREARSKRELAKANRHIDRALALRRGM
jgi:hypothetical protein